MAEVIKALDGEVTVETIKMDVLQLGTGATVTVMLKDEDDTIILASSVMLKKFKGIEHASSIANEIARNLMASLAASQELDRNLLAPEIPDAIEIDGDEDDEDEPVSETSSIPDSIEFENDDEDEEEPK